MNNVVQQPTTIDDFMNYGLEELEAERARRELRQDCKDDLIFLAHNILDYPDVDTPLHRDLAKFLASPGDLKAVFLPRKHFKTTVGTVSFAIQKILNNPSRKMLIAMATSVRSIEVLREIGYHLQYSPKLLYLFPELFSPDVLKVTQKEIIVGKGRKEATMSIGSADGNLVSAHYDDIFFDDLVDMINSATLALCKKTLNWFRASHSLSSFNCSQYVYGTPWAAADTYGWIRGEGRSHFKIYERKAVEEGKPILPTMFCLTDKEREESGGKLESLEETRGILGSYYYSLQFMLELVSQEDAIFKMDDMNYYTDLPKGLNTFMTIDAAVSTNIGSDWSVVMTCGIDSSDNLYVVNYRRGRWLPDRLIDIIFEEYAKYKPLKCGMEKIAFQDVLMYDFKKEQNRRKIFFPMQVLKADRRDTKERRILQLQPVHEAHRVWIKREMIELEDEMMRFRSPRQAGVPDDTIDALAFQLQLIYSPVNKEEIEEDYRVTMDSLSERLKEAQRLRGIMGNEQVSFQDAWNHTGGYH